MNKNTIFILLMILVGCKDSSDEFDATGNFEADEVIISSEAAGKILKLDIEEGKELEANAVVGLVDTTQLYLRKKQLEYSIKAVVAKSPNASVQLAAIKEQIETTQREKKRVQNLLKDDAATQKQLDDINAQLQLLQRQYDASQSSLSITTQSIQSETLPLKAQLDQIEDQLDKSVIKNPFKGTVLTKYALKDEMASQGKALYKVADLSSLVLRAYISGSQLTQIKLGEKVQVLVDAPEGEYKTYEGEIMWVSEKAEFTPKTIQTKDERANLVYAMKIKVKNDGYLKLGMYGEVRFDTTKE
ncbi:MAG TPA: HlyD family efflux transporter periplasmic adaptor subunit [Cyclobacteriaceae bacterium]|nr:HlyD family efflux transporter periplasmic adaptor subunit [Cyclobacteriaceae bacterium]